MRKRRKKVQQVIAVLAMTAILVTMLGVLPERRGRADAASRNITLSSENKTIEILCGKSGKFILDENLIKKSYDDYEEEDDFIYYGMNTVSRAQTVTGPSVTEKPGETGTPAPSATDDSRTPEQIIFSSSDKAALSVKENGEYEAKLGRDVVLTVTAYNSSHSKIYKHDFDIAVKADFSHASLSKTSYTAYQYDNGLDERELSVTIKGAVGLVSDGNTDFNYTSSNSSMYVYCDLSGNKITISTSSAGSTTLKLKLNGKTFRFRFKVKKVQLKGEKSIYLIKGKSKQLKLKGMSQKQVNKKVSWVSSNPKVVKITKNGKIKGRKTGSSIITAKSGKGKVGCVVSVVTSGRLKVIRRGVWIGKHWRYSQARRMQRGYYDCSALVWKSYQKENRYLMSKTYAPTAADLGRWCAQQGKIIKGDNSKNLAKLKMKPGAVMFETGKPNGRYKGIYHVEMFIGYTFQGYGYDGKAIIGTKWANRPDNYYGSGDLWAQL